MPEPTPEALPDNPRWLGSLVNRSAVLPDRTLRRHWLRLIPWLPAADRYTLAAILLDVEHACPG
ncbi:MAG TPA: hypothetical protein VF937_18290 [Chloroflexota bacterium]